MVAPMTRGEVVAKPARSAFAVALVRERNRFQNTRHEVADHCGVSVSKVEEWEKGESVPDPQRFKRLCGKFRRLSATPPNYSTGGSSATLAEKAVQDIQREILKSKEPEREPPPVEDFHVGLKRIREANGLTSRELADLFGYVSGAISNWETGRNAPSEENIELLYEVLPDLKAAVDVGAVKAPSPQRARGGYRSKTAIARAQPQLSIVKDAGEAQSIAKDTEPAQSTIATPVKPEVKSEVKPVVKAEVKSEAIPMRITGSDDPIVGAANRYAASRRALLLAQKKAHEVRLLVAAADAALVNAQTEHDAALAAFDAIAAEPTGEP